MNIVNQLTKFTWKLSIELDLLLFLRQNSAYFFWKTYDRQEIDLIESQGENLTAFEMKWGDKKTKIPVAFANAYPEATFNVVNKENYFEFLSM